MNISKFKILKGTVISNKMDKTIIVRVSRKVKHKIYMKMVTKFTKFFVHSEEKLCSIGDIVLFREVAPISKKKHWVLVKNLNNKDVNL